MEVWGVPFTGALVTALSAIIYITLVLGLVDVGRRLCRLCKAFCKRWWRKFRHH
jgi:hypothetical protein